MEMKLRGYLEVKIGSRRLRKKSWRRSWIVLDVVESLNSPALIIRIYGSHLYEDRALPLFTVTLTDVHALHRTQSKSHQFSFSIDGCGQCLNLSGDSETESQHWMKKIRHSLWPSIFISSNVLSQYNSYDSFDVSLIDNVHSEMSRLQGFYGRLLLDAKEIILLEGRSGVESARWNLKTIKKWFLVSKVSSKDDREKIVVIMTYKNKLRHEGIFCFYTCQAIDLIRTLTHVNSHQRTIQPFIKMNVFKTLLRVQRAMKKDSQYNKKNPLRSEEKTSLQYLETKDKKKKKSVSESNLLTVSQNTISVSKSSEDCFYQSFEDLDLDLDSCLFANSKGYEASVVLIGPKISSEDSGTYIENLSLNSSYITSQPSNTSNISEDSGVSSNSGVFSNSESTKPKYATIRKSMTLPYHGLKHHEEFLSKDCTLEPLRSTHSLLKRQGTGFFENECLTSSYSSLYVSLPYDSRNPVVFSHRSPKISQLLRSSTCDNLDPRDFSGVLGISNSIERLPKQNIGGLFRLSREESSKSLMDDFLFHHHQEQNDEKEEII